MKCKAVKIFGISHIVHSTENLEDAESNFIALGYSRKSENFGSLNPPQKSPLVPHDQKAAVFFFLGGGSGGR